METLRFADPATTVSYPLPVRGNAQWIASDAGTLWTLRLPSIPAGSIGKPVSTMVHPGEEPTASSMCTNMPQHRAASAGSAYSPNHTQHRSCGAELPTAL